MNKRELLQYIGDYSQLFGIEEYTFTGGKAKGVKAFDVRTGSGLEFTVLADKCLDIGRLSYKGVNCSYFGKMGVVAPEFFNGGEQAFLRNSFAGFLTTCGLRNVGSPCTDNGEYFGLHGSISNIPGEEVCASTDLDGDVPIMTISGQMRETRFFGENLLLKRKIGCPYGQNKIWIHDKVENRGFNDELLMILYHFNIGYPLLDQDAELLMPSREVYPRDAEASKGTHNYHQMQPPTHAYAEQVFYHDLKTDVGGNTCVAIVNRKLELGIAFYFNKKQFFNLTQWKQMGEGEYVIGIEPCNCYVGGRLDPQNKSIMTYLKPGESKDFDIEIEIIAGLRDIDTIAKQINSI